jgi:hypothetical protein
LNASKVRRGATDGGDRRSERIEAHKNAILAIREAKSDRGAATAARTRMRRFIESGVGMSAGLRRQPERKG